MYLYASYRQTGKKLKSEEVTVISDDINIPLVWDGDKINEDGSTGAYVKAE
jgi:hypothetical protein